MTTAHYDEGRIPVFTLGDRIRKSLRDAGVGINEVADELEIDRQVVSRWLSDRNKRGVPAVYLKLIALRCGVNYEWLKDGLSPTTRRKAHDRGGRGRAVAAAA